MSFLPSLSPGNVTSFAPSSFKYDITDLQWERPTEWLDLNVPDGVPEKIIGLVAVHPNSEGGAARNYVAFNLDTDDNSSYTVNWGDGNTETLASNVTHYHVYDYDDITSDTSTMKSTTFRGYKQAKFEVTLNNGVSFGGSQGQINFDVDGPYVTNASYNRRSGPNILDLFVSSSNATTHYINNSRPMRMLEQLEIRNTSNNRLTNPHRLYRGCRSLRSIPFVPYIYNSGTRDYLYAFYECVNLTFLPDDFADPNRYWFKNSSRLQATFYRCFSLKFLPEGLFGDSEQTNCSSYYQMFYECRNLRYIPYLGVRTNGNTNIRYMFFNCLDLKAIPRGFNMQKAQAIDRTFYACRECYDFSQMGNLDDIERTSNFAMDQAFGNLDSLKEFPYIGQFTRATNVTNLFTSSTQIERFDSQYTELDFTNATDMQQTFYAMESLQEIPTIRVNALTNDNSLYRTFFNNYNLKRIVFTGMTDGPNNGEYFQCFYQCVSLQYLEGVDFSHANDSGDYSNMFYLVRNLVYIKFPGADGDETGFKYSVDLRYNPLNRDAMLEIFDHLCTITHSATLDLRNNSYTSDLTADDKLIATNKGWTLSL